MPEEHIQRKDSPAAEVDLIWYWSLIDHTVFVVFHASGQRRKVSLFNSPARPLRGVAMAEGICVEWVSNSCVSAEVAHMASQLSAAAGFGRKKNQKERRKIWEFVRVLLPVTAAQFLHLRCSFIHLYVLCSIGSPIHAALPRVMLHPLSFVPQKWSRVSEKAKSD